MLKDIKAKLDILSRELETIKSDRTILKRIKNSRTKNTITEIKKMVWFKTRLDIAERKSINYRVEQKKEDMQHR